MWEQLKPWLEASARAAGSFVAEAATQVGRLLLIAWEVVRPAVVFAFNVLVALVLIFEEWGWRPLSALVARLARFRLWAMTELWIAGLPPYGALVALGVPSAILIPAKLARRLPARHRTLHHRRHRHHRRQVRLDGAYCPHLPTDQAGADADTLVRVCLRCLRALAGSAVHARPFIVGLALRPHPQRARRAACARNLVFSGSAT